jgi:hypothetical protein
MKNKTVMLALAVTLCASVALGTVDVGVRISSPEPHEEPGLISMQVVLTNLGDIQALVPRLDVIVPSGYNDYLQNIAVAVGESTTVTTVPWVYDGGTETCTAYITYPEDMNHHNDTAVVIVNATGISGPAEMEPHAGMSLALLPSPLAGNVLHVGYSLNQAGPAKVTLFDISGRPVAKRDFAGTSTGELPLDLHLLSGGVYLVRLDDGHQSVVRTLVVQR